MNIAHKEPRRFTSADLVTMGFVEGSPGVLEKAAGMGESIAGNTLPAPKPGRTRDSKFLERRFLEVFLKVGGDIESLTPEFRFFATRRWRADFYHAPSGSLIEGGLYGFRTKDKSKDSLATIGGKHTSADGYRRDAEKYNTAVSLGFRVFRLTSKMLTDEYVSQLVGWLTVPRAA
jgi:hypothetical protein